MILIEDPPTYKVKGYTIPELMDMKLRKEAELEEIKKKLRLLMNAKINKK